MAEFEIFLLVIGSIIGFLIAWYIISKQKWGDKAETLNERWKRKIAELEKEYDVKLEKTNTTIEKLKEENKTNLEKVSKEWQIRYIKDIEELRKLFKESEKVIKLKSVSSSRRSLVGKFIEKFVPFLSDIEYSPSDMHFLGQPIDYIVFDGLHEDSIKKIIFLEVKTGDSKLTKREKSLKEAVEKKKVSWKEFRVDTATKKTPDKDIETSDESIKELYEDIDEKLKLVKNKGDIDLDSEEDFDGDEDLEEEIEEYDVVCPKCDNEFTIEIDEDEDLEKGIRVTCPHCNKSVSIKEEDVL